LGCWINFNQWWTKIKVIKAVRELLGLGLVEAKGLVEKHPVILNKGVKKSEAEEIQKKLETVGCKITLIWGLLFC